ncbi:MULTISPECIES: hypothetical protein [Methylomonas]|jgi:hypothetical protein|uniref:Uncharacterized protein n=1 Tax=Methylomonas methanica TaxID=421 RepID=A0A177MP84_METMH|nr:MULTISPECIES: hypothetical protein [Methylomonas]NOV30668.1 hypothetical protein [Methylomonas sp. ZR1]OAI00949.1 hypothetical protein A1332_18090 [Methylomonas methanica]OAI07204.1 hypothetical protein A1353_07560 [Methylomonas methanica]
MKTSLEEYLSAYGIKSSGFKLAVILVLLGLTSINAYAHRGAQEEVDACKTRLGFERVHFTAYTPTLTGDAEYCDIIPGLGPTKLVFDYEGKRLRNLNIEFEITKEPEGTRIFYQEPQLIKTGTTNGSVDFSQYGAGHYLAHIAIVDKDKRLDSHIPFSVGLESLPGKSYMPQLVIIGSLFLMVYGLFRVAQKETPNHTPET